MTTLIINSFSFQATTPPFNLGYLKGILLKENIFDTKQIDVNLLLWDQLLNPDYLSILKFNKELVNKNPNMFCKKIKAIEFTLLQNSVVENITYALNILKSKDFYEFKKFIWAQKIIYDALSLIYYSTGTFFTTHLPHWAQIGFDVKKVKDIYNLATSKTNNPLVGLSEEVIIPKIKAENPDVILVDIMFPWDIIPALTLNILIKKHLPHVHINFAGQGFDEFSFSRLKNNLKKDKSFFFGFDSIFMNRNDLGIVDLIKNHKTGLHNIDNLYYIENNNIVCNEENLNHKFFDQVVPNYDDFNFEAYHIPEPVLIDRLSHKCFWAKCNYCSINSNISIEQKVNIEAQVNKIKELSAKYAVSNYWFLDEGCTTPLALKFAESILKEKIDIKWSLRTRIDKDLNKENLEVLYKSGLRELWIGLEHVSPYILEKMNKTSFPGKYAGIASSILKEATELGIGLHFCHILGFPSETEQHRKDVFNFYTDHKEYIAKKPFFTTFNVFGLMYDSHMHKHPEEFGITPSDYNGSDYNMISVPYESKWNDDTKRPEVLKNLNKWGVKYTSALLKSKIYTYFWYVISDSPYEFLFKKSYSHNPFLNSKDFWFRSMFKLYYLFSTQKRLRVKTESYMRKRVLKIN